MKRRVNIETRFFLNFYIGKTGGWDKAEKHTIHLVFSNMKEIDLERKRERCGTTRNELELLYRETHEFQNMAHREFDIF